MKVSTEPRLPESPKYSDESSLTQEQSKTSKREVRQGCSRVYGSAADLGTVSLNGGNIRKTAEDSIRQIQAARASNGGPIQVTALRRDLKTPSRVHVENGQKASSPLDALRGKAAQTPTDDPYTFPDQTTLQRCLSKHPSLGYEFYRKNGITKEVSLLAAKRFANGELVDGGITMGALLVVADLKRGIDGYTGEKLPQVIPETGSAKNAIPFHLESALKDCSNSPNPQEMPHSHLSPAIDERSPAKVLHGLWKCSSPASFFDHSPNLLADVEKRAWVNSKKLEQELQQNPMVDYYGGRCIKTDVSQRPLDLSSYTEYCVPSMTPEEVIEKCILTEEPDEKPKGLLEKAARWMEKHTPPGGHYEVVP